MGNIVSSLPVLIRILALGYEAVSSSFEGFFFCLFFASSSAHSMLNCFINYEEQHTVLRIDLEFTSHLGYTVIYTLHMICMTVKPDSRMKIQ